MDETDSKKQCRKKAKGREDASYGEIFHKDVAWEEEHGTGIREHCSTNEK